MSKLIVIIGSTFFGRMRPRSFVLAQMGSDMFGMNLARSTTANEAWWWECDDDMGLHECTGRWGDGISRWPHESLWITKNTG